jgi:N-acetylmuramoyl-L-alanine amidase
MNRLRVKAGKVRAGCAVAAAVLALLVAAVGPARAGDAGSPTYWYAGTKLVFERPQYRGAALAVASDDLGLGRFLSKLGATLSFQPGQSYVVVTSGDRRTVTFTVGDARYMVGGVMAVAGFAPYLSGGVLYLPFVDLARALYVDPVDDAGTTVLQPQIASLDVKAESRMTIVTLRGASPLHFKRLSDAADGRVALAFSGIASTLERDRDVRGPGLRGVSIEVNGTPRNPTTVVTFDAPPGGAHALAPSDSDNSLSVAFAPPGTQLGGTAIPVQGDATLAATDLATSANRPAAAPLAPPPPPLPVAAPGAANSSQNAAAAAPQYGAQTSGGAGNAPAPAGLPAVAVTAFDTIPTDAGLNVRLAISGPVGYQWHRLGDNRWYLDLKPATLAVPAQDQTLQNDAVQSLRLKAFVGPTDHMQTVRVALTLATPRVVNLVPSDGGLMISVERDDDLDPQVSGSGELTGGRIAAAPPPPNSGDPEGAPSGDAGPNPAPTWKFAPPAPGTNGKLIMIDPGHGGSDTGATHNGLVEKDLNLDIARRLRAVLVARGWQVKMTRDSDVDVYQPNDSAHDELQARDDIANAAGARMLVSIHCNAFTMTSLNGTTTYYYRADSYGLASAVHARLAANLATKDDGIRKENFYVIHHGNMPSILIETAFVTNASDAAQLRSPAFLQKVATSIADGVGDYAAGSQPVSTTSSGADGL